MTLIPRSDKKRVYALLAAVPAILFYLVLQAYLYLGHLRFLADGVLIAAILVETILLTILLTKLKIAWWLRRKRFALVRFLVVLASLLVSTFLVILHILT